MNIDKKQLNTAKKYSEAFFKIALEFDCVEKFYNELLSVLEVLKKSPDLKVYLENDLISKNDKKEVIYKVFKKDFDLQTINLLNVLVDNKRINIIETVCSLYEKMYEDNQNISKVEVFSAIPLNEDTKKRLVEKLEQKANQKIIAEYVVDTNILGGLIIKIQEKTIDLSLKTKLNEMKKQLIKG